MKLVIAMMKHETNTFSPVRTGWKRFQEWGVHFGPDARRAYETTAMPLAAYIALAREAGADIVTPVAAEAMPSGPVTADAFHRLAEPIYEAVANGCDAALLDLHGAMVTEETMDGEGTLLAQIRRIAPDLPIAVTCDFHCNLTRKMVDHCTALIGYKTYPHVDMYDVALQIGRVVIQSLEGRCRPRMSRCQLPLLSHTLKQGTDDFPMVPLIQAAREMEERDGVLAASIFGGFPLADIPDAGTSTLVVTDGQAEEADRMSRRLAEQAWDFRESFIYRTGPLSASLEQAGALTEFPVILLDHEDNCGSGGTQDVMAAIKAVMDYGLEDVAVAAVFDPVAVRTMQSAGVGAELELSLGGKTDMPTVSLKGKPLALRGRVKALTDGNWTVEGPMYTGVNVRMGPTAVFETRGVEIVVVSRHHEPWDPGVFTSVGIRPESKKYLLLKSRIHYRAGFAPIGRHTLTLDGEGVTTSRNDLLAYEHIRRPVYPLDPDTMF